MHKLNRLLLALTLICTIVSATVFAQLTATVTPANKTIYAGEGTDISFTIQNSGFRSLHDITIFLTLPSEIGMSRNLSIEELVPGATYPYSINIPTLDTTPQGNYIISMKGTHDNVEEELASAVVAVKEMPLKITLQLEKTEIAPNDNNTLTITAENAGAETISDVSITVEFPNRLSANETLFPIGTLTSNQQAQKKFFFTVGNEAQGDYHITIRADFRDATGGQHSILKLVVLSTQGFRFGQIEAIITIVILILVLRFILGLRHKG